ATGGRHRQVGQPAVLVHPGPGVPRLGQQRAPPAARTEMHDRYPPSLGGPAPPPPPPLAHPPGGGGTPAPPRPLRGGGGGVAGGGRGGGGGGGGGGGVALSVMEVSSTTPQARHGSFPRPAGEVSRHVPGHAYARKPRRRTCARTRFAPTGAR